MKHCTTCGRKLKDKKSIYENPELLEGDSDANS